jgi:hypothetical protein
MLLEFLNCGCGVGIFSISHRMPLVGSGNRFQNLGMNASVIVTGETARWFHCMNNVAEASRDAVSGNLRRFFQSKVPA